MTKKKSKVTKAIEDQMKAVAKVKNMTKKKPKFTMTDEHLIRLKKARVGYMDMTDFEDELGVASDGVRVYPSPRSLLRHNPCAKECGIVRVDVVFVGIERDPVPARERMAKAMKRTKELK